LVETHQEQDPAGARRPVRVYNAFVRDGPQTVVETTIAFHYEARKNCQFEAIECDGRWFFAYEWFTACSKAPLGGRAWGWRRAAGAVSLGMWTGLRSFRASYLGRRRPIGRNGSSRQPGRGIANAKRFPCSWTRAFTGLGDLLLNAALDSNPKTSIPIGRRPRAQPGAEVLCRRHRQLPRSPQHWKRRAAGERRRQA